MTVMIGGAISRHRLAPPPVSSRLLRWVRGKNLPLVAILGLQLAGMLSLQNTPFQDEALYLYAGHRFLDNVFTGAVVHEPFSSYFSGLPYFYPVIGAALDQLGGVELARALSTVCVLGITIAAFRVSRALFGERVGLLSAAVLATQTSLLFVGRLATYDALSFALFAIAAMVAVETTRRVVGRTAVVIVLCCLAVFAKYAVAAVVPAAVVLLWLAPGISRDGLTRLRVILTAGITLAIVGCGAWLLLHNDHSLFAGLSQTTTSRDISDKAPLAQMLAHEVRRIGVVMALAVGGLVALGRWGIWRRTFILSVIVTVVALVVPAYHAYVGELTSVDKHLGLTAFLLAPLAGLALDSLIAARGRVAGWAAGAAILVLAFSLAVADARSLFHAWPDSTALHRVLLQTVRDGDTRVLAEEIEVPQYYLVGSSAQYWQFTGLDYFEYTNKAKEFLTGERAYAAAIDEGYFGVIAFRYGPSESTATALSSEIAASGRYDEVAKLPFTITSGKGAYSVWRRIDARDTDPEKE